MKRDESQNVEYKEAWNDKYLAWICGYANAQGGTIYFGINDEQLVAVAQATPPVMPPVAKPSESMIDAVQRKVLVVLRDNILSTSELAKLVGFSQPRDMRRRYLRLLLDMGLVEYTIPQKPNSRLQKYRLTEEGRTWEDDSFRANPH